MDFFSNILKNTVNKVETLGKNAVTTLSPSATNSPDEQIAPSVDQLDAADGTATSDAAANHDSNADSNATNSGEVLANKGDEKTSSRSGSADYSGKDEVDPNASFNSAEMSQKALDSAKYFGNFLFNVANKAGQTVSATAKQIKTTVESVGIMQEFTKEQQDFIKEHGGNTDISEPPWVGCEDEQKVKDEILSLSQDKRNFVRNPPAGVEFSFDMNASFPVALSLLREDLELSKMRYEIVPKLVNEETFWRNYFYRVSLIKQDPNFTTAMAEKQAGSWNSSRSSSSEGPDDPNDQSLSAGDSEFVSDSFQASGISVDEVRKDMVKLGIRKTTEDLDDEFSKDLQEFEVVSGSVTGKVDDDEINRELADFDIK